MKNKNIIWFPLIAMLFICINIHSSNIEIEDNLEKQRLTDTIIDGRYLVQSGWILTDCDTSRWHPEEFRIIYPDMKITFNLPLEKDKSGVRNLFFQSTETGNIIMLDEEIKGPEPRSYTKFDYCKYNMILLYNNGKYIKYDNIEFKKNSSIDIDLTKSVLCDPDSQSKELLTMRAFNTVIGDSKRMMKIDKDEKTIASSDSGIEIRGYVFAEYLESSSPDCHIFGGTNFSRPLAFSQSDGFFLVELSNTSLPIHITRGKVLKPIELYLTKDCGLFIVMEDHPEMDRNTRYGNSQ